LDTDVKFDFIEDWSFIQDPNLKLTQEDFKDANCMLDYPLAFYGGYLQLAGHKKDEFLRNKFVEKLIWIIKQMQLDRKKILEEKEAVNNVAMMNFALA
jgi:hypothetical protein